MTPENPFQLDEQMRYYLLNSTKWARFLAIVGMVTAILIAITAFFTGTIMSTLSAVQQSSPMPAGIGVMLTIFYLAGAILYFIPCLFLYRFAKRTRTALESSSREQLLSGMDHLNRFFKFVGILTLIYLIIVVLAFVVAIIGGLIGAAMA